MHGNQIKANNLPNKHYKLFWFYTNMAAIEKLPPELRLQYLAEVILPHNIPISPVHPIGMPFIECLPND